MPPHAIWGRTGNLSLVFYYYAWRTGKRICHSFEGIKITLVRSEVRTYEPTDRELSSGAMEKVTSIVLYKANSLM